MCVWEGVQNVRKVAEGVVWLGQGMGMCGTVQVWGCVGRQLCVCVNVRRQAEKERRVGWHGRQAGMRACPCGVLAPWQDGVQAGGRWQQVVRGVNRQA